MKSSYLEMFKGLANNFKSLVKLTLSPTPFDKDDTLNIVWNNLPEGYTYRPLPDSVTINSSDIQGLGLYTIAYIFKDTVIGKSHMKVGEELIRLPLGGFINHSLTPNCIIIEIEKSCFYLKAIETISSSIEITVDYFKSPCGINIIDQI